jgi:hypothetical protein
VNKLIGGRMGGAILTTAVIGLTLTTSYIHLGLGGLLFTLNGLGYAGLAALFLLGAVAPHPLVERFSWAPRLMLAGYAAMTIGGYLVMGPFFTLGWIAKGVEVALITLIAIDILRVYGSPMGFARTAVASVFGQRREAVA